jgi:hypothetical protein
MRTERAIAALGKGRIWDNQCIELQGGRTLDVAFPPEVFSDVAKEGQVFESDLKEKVSQTVADKEFASWCDATVKIEDIDMPILRVDTSEGPVELPPIFLGWPCKTDIGMFGQLINRKDVLLPAGVGGGAPAKGCGDVLTYDVLVMLFKDFEIKGPPAQVPVLQARRQAYLEYLTKNETKMRAALTPEAILKIKVDQLRAMNSGRPSFYALALQPIYNSTEISRSRAVVGVEVLLRCVGNGRQTAPYEDLKLFAKKAPIAYKEFIACQIDFLAERAGYLAAVPYASVNWFSSLFEDKEFLTRCEASMKKLGEKLSIDILEYNDMEPTSTTRHPVTDIVESLLAFQTRYPDVKLNTDDLTNEETMEGALEVANKGVRIHGFKLDPSFLSKVFLTTHMANNPLTPAHIRGGRNEWITKSNAMFPPSE